MMLEDIKNELKHEKYIQFLPCFIKNPLYSGLGPNILASVSLESNDLSTMSKEAIITIHYDVQLIPMAPIS